MTVTFTPVGSTTRMSVTVGLAEAVPEMLVREWLAAGIREGWNKTIDRLVDVV